MSDNLTDPTPAGDGTSVAGIADPGEPHGSATVQELLARGLALLGVAASLDVEVLLAHALGCRRSYLITHASEAVPPGAAAAYQALLARATRAEPVAYLLGTREFWSLPLQVTPAVLIPRPETELAVERCLALLPRDAPCRLCDLGTGSGAIALALASERPAWRITASDHCPAALQVARGNAARLGLSQVEFLGGDWFEPLGARRFELLVSNPPYIGAADPALATLRYEPATALSPGPSGLEALLSLIHTAPTYLAPGGWLVLEHGAGQGAAVALALVAAGYARVRCHRDLAGHERVSEGQRL